MTPWVGGKRQFHWILDAVAAAPLHLGLHRFKHCNIRLLNIDVSFD